jgi:hypothetical protein
LDSHSLTNTHFDFEIAIFYLNAKKTIIKWITMKIIWVRIERQNEKQYITIENSEFNYKRFEILSMFEKYVHKL